MKDKQKVDVEKIDLERMKEKTTDIPGLLPYGHHGGSALVKPEDIGKVKGRSLSAMQSQTDMQMAQIYKQMQLLADQAKMIQERVNFSERIYKVAMGFEPLINHHYFLYEKEDGTDFLSMLSPEDWGRKKPFSKFLGEVKLLADHTWEIVRKGE